MTCPLSWCSRVSSEESQFTLKRMHVSPGPRIDFGCLGHDCQHSECMLTTSFCIRLGSKWLLTLASTCLCVSIHECKRVSLIPRPCALSKLAVTSSRQKPPWVQEESLSAARLVLGEPNFGEPPHLALTAWAVMGPVHFTAYADRLLHKCQKANHALSSLYYMNKEHGTRGQSEACTSNEVKRFFFPSTPIETLGWFPQAIFSTNNYPHIPSFVKNPSK